jgi:hypothetical protein
LLVAQEDPKAPPSAEKARELLDQRRRSIEFGRTWVKDYRETVFIDQDFARLPETLVWSLDMLLGWALNRDAHPHKRSAVPRQVADGIDLKVRVAVAQDANQDDLIEYMWTFDGNPVRAVASINALKMDFDLAQLPDCRRARNHACMFAVRHWVEKVVKLRDEYNIMDSHVKYEVDLPWPDVLADGIQFSSAPERDLMRLAGISRWYERVDVVVENGVLAVLIYNKPAQLMGYQDGSRWFPDDFRAAVMQKAREQRR